MNLYNKRKHLLEGVIMEPQASTSPKKRFSVKFKKPSRKVSITVLVAVLVIVGAAGGYFLVKNSSKDGNYSYKYKDLNSYSLSGDTKGNGITLQKPVELAAIGSSSAGQTQGYLNHAVTKNSQQQAVTLAQIFLATVNTGTELPDGYIKNIDTMISDPKNVSHEVVVKPVKDFVTQRLKTTLATTFSEAKPLTTANIKSNAWYLTFTATPKNSKDKATQPDLSGEVVMGIGKTTFYYVMVYSISSNWQSNQKVWDQVINSIKLDQ